MKQKLAALYKKEVPTGIPMISEHVQRPKYTRLKITEGCELGEGDKAITMVHKTLSSQETTHSDSILNSRKGYMKSQTDVDGYRKRGEEKKIMEQDLNGLRSLETTTSAPSQSATPSPVALTPSPRPLVTRKDAIRWRSPSEGDAILAIVQSSRILELPSEMEITDGKKRTVKRNKTEENIERFIRGEEREDEKVRREADKAGMVLERRKRDEFIQILCYVIPDSTVEEV